MTLVELLTAVGIIAALAGIAIPAVAKARDSAKRVACTNNVRGLGLAFIAFSNEHRGVLPGANWGAQDNASSVGWLYRATDRGPNPEHRTKGQVWKPSGESHDLYRCPSHDLSGVDGTASPTEHLTSYIVNGAICGYGNSPVSYSHRQFKPDDILFFEATKPDMKDAAAKPNDVTLQTRHGRLAVVGRFDGTAESFTRDDWANELNQSPPTRRTRLWCNPGTTDGH